MLSTVYPFVISFYPATILEFAFVPLTIVSADKPPTYESTYALVAPS